MANTLGLQYAGELGEISLSYGLNLKSNYQIEFIYGTHHDFDTYAIRNNFNSYYFNDNFVLNTGLTLYQVNGLGNNRIPGNYYEQSVSRRLYLYYALEIQEKNFSLYLENGINDVSLEAYYNNKDVYLSDIMSLALGYRYKF